MFLTLTLAGVALAGATPEKLNVAGTTELSVQKDAVNNLENQVLKYMEQRHSFLKGGDDTVKNGLFVTQPLRSAEQVRVNVVERAPGGPSGSSGAAEAAHLRALFDSELAGLRSSFARFHDITQAAAAPVEVITVSIEQQARKSAAKRNLASFLALEARFKPVVELSLTSTDAHGAVADAISGAESASARGIASDLGALNAAYDSVLAKASLQLSGVIARARRNGSFLQGGIVEPTIAVRVLGGESDNSAGVAAVKRIEARRNAAESAMVTSARAEFEELARVVIAEYEKQLRARSSFLGAQFSRALNIRIKKADLGSLSSIIADSQNFRDREESVLRAKINLLQVTLVKQLNAVAASALATK